MNPGVLEEESDCEFEGLPQEESQDSWEACLYCSILMCHSVCDCVVWSMHMCITVQIDPADQLTQMMLWSHMGVTKGNV